MAILKIARMGHPILRARAVDVPDPTAPEVARLVSAMVETMEDADGTGLAAPQVHMPWRVVVYKVEDDRADEEEEGEGVPLTVLINPVIEFLDWVRRIGARPIVLDATTHDELVALASHLPQLASTAMAATLSQQPAASRIGQVAGPGLIDSTRLALSPFDVWSDILNTNTAAIDKALAVYIDTLQQIRRELAAGELQERFEAAGKFSREIRQEQP